MKTQPSGSQGLVLRWLLVAAVLLAFPALAESDLDPPEVVSATVSPGRVDTSGGPQEVEVVVRLRDSLSGLGHYELPFVPILYPVGVMFRPKGNASTSQILSISLPAVTGSNGAVVNPFDVEFRGRLTVPPGAIPGEWVLDRIVGQDLVGNFLGLDSTGLALRGLVPPHFEVLGSEDSLPPRIESLSFATNRVTLSEIPQNVRILARVRDDGSGVDSQQFVGGLSFRGDHSGRTVLLTFGPGSGQLIEGDSRDGVYAVEFAFDRHSTPPDTYRLQPIQLRDRVGNFSVLMPSEAELRGFQTTITVEQDSGTPLDLRPPEFVLLNLPTATVDTSEAAGKVTAEIVVRDDDDGPVSASVSWMGPRGLHHAQLLGFRPPGGLPWVVCTGSFPAHCESGEWHVQRVELRDGVGNSTTVTGNDLERLGMPTRMVVTTSPRLHLDRQDGTTVAWWRRVPGRYHVQTSRNLQGWTDLLAPLISVGDSDVSVLRGDPVGSEDVFFRLIRD